MKKLNMLSTVILHDCLLKCQNSNSKLGFAQIGVLLVLQTGLKDCLVLKPLLLYGPVIF